MSSDPGSSASMSQGATPPQAGSSLGTTTCLLFPV